MSTYLTSAMLVGRLHIRHLKVCVLVMKGLMYHSINGLGLGSIGVCL